ncbi:GNAT family N-acetyltransferase [Opitutus terrae]|uniref:GCN5-related N-acetyltransferase n=1 Tax=Opitutus terrae (strain DSM 11246 / JCM 15787 / PB90-1) TaxID=452637 RepID=B1ZN62_OPITP|nr:GNAT family N-acetyltransferase [Opitutus terrae]ACB73431.1 GCN5-related N-acetyltransferase [Opitutus terrae PB90-1]
MSPTLTIREASESDLPAVLALYGHPEIDGPALRPVGEAREIYRRFQSYPNYHLFVASIGQDIVGTFTLLIIDNLAHAGARSGLVEDVVVSSAHQYQGIGKQMMRFALERCREAGCYKLALSSNLKRTAAHQFYESLGFEKHGHSFVVPVDAGAVASRSSAERRDG